MPITVPAATSASHVPGPTSDQAAAATRSADARLARVYLRGGLLDLARATLETMAGAGTLDTQAMADLAEARWRSGDLEGAAEAARAHQAAGGDEAMAALILAEELLRTGSAGDSQQLVDEVSQRVGGAIDQLFALEPRADAWPAADPGWMPVGAAAPGSWGLLVGGSEVAAPSPTTWLPAPLTPTAEPEASLVAPDVVARHPGGPTSGSPMAAHISGAVAADELEMVERNLENGAIVPAADRLAVLLRLDPALAPIILTAADRVVGAVDPADAGYAALQLVRGDAYRLMGRETEATAAYQAAHQVLRGGLSTKEPT